MKPWQLDELRRALERRRETLVDELKRDAARLREERADDIGDDVSADVLVELDQAELSRYGICADCGAAIPYDRLLYAPAAERCLDCQARHEKTYGR